MRRVALCAFIAFLAACPSRHAADAGSPAPDASALDASTPSDAGGVLDAAMQDAAMPPTVFGLLPDGTRDKLHWPFSSLSIWNTPIGSAAQYRPAGITPNTHGGYATQFTQDQDVIVMTPSAPATQVFYNGEGWGGGDRCVAQGAVLTTVPVPADFVLPNSGENNSSAFLSLDGTTVLQNQPFTRCTAGEPATTYVAFANEDIHGEGIRGAHGGSGLSALGGAVRVGEFTAGAIHHAMKVNLWARDYYHCCNIHWPAVTVDGYADPVMYGGTDPDFGPGTLLALLPDFDNATLQTEPAQILARAFRDYGAYVVDDTYWNAWALITEQGPAGRVVDEFEHLYGFPMRPADGDPFMADLITIFGALQLVTNNAEQSVGGGGAPRVSVAPPLGN